MVHLVNLQLQEQADLLVVQVHPEQQALPANLILQAVQAVQDQMVLPD